MLLGIERVWLDGDDPNFLMAKRLSFLLSIKYFISIL